MALVNNTRFRVMAQDMVQSSPLVNNTRCRVMAKDMVQCPALMKNVIKVLFRTEPANLFSSCSTIRQFTITLVMSIISSSYVANLTCIDARIYLFPTNWTSDVYRVHDYFSDLFRLIIMSILRETVLTQNVVPC